MLIEVDIAGIDGSDVHLVRGELSWVNDRAPLILGDELVGRVVEIGEDARRVRGMDVGDRVTVEARWPCGGCRTCDAGQYYLCEDPARQAQWGYGTIPLSEPGELWGSYATHCFVPPAATVHRVPQSLSDQAALVASSVLANGIAWVNGAGVKDSDHLVVIGPGPQGLACVLAAVERGATVTLVGTMQDTERLAMVRDPAVRALQISPGDPVDDIVQRVLEHGPVDVVIDTAGVPAAKALAMELVRPMGTIAHQAVASPATQPIDWLTVLMKQITMTSIVSHPHAVPGALDLAVALAARGIDVGTWVTHTFPLEEVADAIATAGYETAERPVKTALTFP